MKKMTLATVIAVLLSACGQQSQQSTAGAAPATGSASSLPTPKKLAQWCGIVPDMTISAGAAQAVGISKDDYARQVAEKYPKWNLSGAVDTVWNHVAEVAKTFGPVSAGAMAAQGWTEKNCTTPEAKQTVADVAARDSAARDVETANSRVATWKQSEEEAVEDVRQAEQNGTEHGGRSQDILDAQREQHDWAAIAAKATGDEAVAAAKVTSDIQ